MTTNTEAAVVPPAVQAFPMTFGPAARAVDLLAKIANAGGPFAGDAAAVIDNWRAQLASPKQIRRVDQSDDLEVDSHGACVSESGRGYFIQTWTFVRTR